MDKFTQVLVVDSNPIARDEIKSHLNQLGYHRVQGVATAAEALRVLASESIGLVVGAANHQTFEFIDEMAPVSREAATVMITQSAV